MKNIRNNSMLGAALLVSTTYIVLPPAYAGSAYSPTPESLLQDRLVAGCYGEPVAAASSPSFVDAWFKESGKDKEVCSLILADAAAVGRSERAVKVSAPALSALTEDAVETLEGWVGDRVLRKWPEADVDADATTKRGGFPRGFLRRFAAQDIIGMYGPLAAAASGGMLDGDLLNRAIASMRSSSVKTAVFIATYGSCMMAKRNQEILTGERPETIFQSDVVSATPFLRQRYDLAARGWRSQVLRYRNFLLDISRNVSSSALEQERFRLWIDSLALGRYLGAGDAQCSRDGELERWKATFRLSGGLAKKTAFEVSETVRTCSSSLLIEGVASLPLPKVERIQFDEARANNASSDPLDAVGGPSFDVGSSSLGADPSLGVAALRYGIALKFGEWLAGKYGTASVPTETGKVIGAAAGQPRDQIAFPSPASRDLFISDWKMPDWPCDASANRSALLCEEPNDAANDADVTGSGVGDKDKLSLRFSAEDFIGEAISRLLRATEMQTSFALVSAEEDVSTGGYRVRGDPATSCVQFLRKFDSTALRNRREVVWDERYSEKEKIGLKLESDMQMADYVFSVRHQTDQEKLFSYAVKMRQAMAREDTSRQQEKVRRRENVSDMK